MHVGRPVPFQVDSHFGTSQVETRFRANLCAGHDCLDLSEDPSAQGEELVEARSGNFNVDIPPFAQPPLKQTALGHDADDPGKIGQGPVKHRDQVADFRIVIGAAPHEHAASTRHVEEIADAGPVQGGFFRGPGFGVPMGSEDGLDGLSQPHVLLRVVAGRGQDHAEDQIAIPAGQVFGFRQQLRDDAEGERRESEYDQHAPADAPAHPVHEIGDPVGSFPLPAGRPGPATGCVLRREPRTGGHAAPAAVRGRQNARGQARDHGNGDQKTQPDSGADGNGNVSKELSGLFLDEHDGHEDGDGREGAGQHRAPDFGGAVIGGLPQRFARLPVTIDVFQDDDGIVDQHPPRQRHAGETDHVHVPVQHPQGDESAHDADGNGQPDHEGRARRAQEQEENRHGEDAADDQVLLHQVDGTVDVVRFVVDLKQLEAPAVEDFVVQFPDGFPEVLHRVQGIGPGLADGVDGNGIAPHFPDDVLRLLIRDADGRHVPHVHRCAVPPGDNDVPHVFGALVFAGGPDDVRSFAFIEIPRAVIAVFLIQRLRQFQHRQGTDGQFQGVHEHAQLPFAAPVHVRRGHARNALEPRLDHVFRKIPQGVDFDGVAFQRFENKPPHGAAARIGAADHGFVDFVGIFLDLVEPVGDAKKRRLGIGAGRKPEDDFSGVVGTFAEHFLQPLHPFQLLFLFVHDFAFDFLGAGPLPPGRNRDLGLGDVGRELDGQLHERHEPEEGHENHDHGRGHRIPDGELDDVHRSLPGASTGASKTRTGWPGNRRSLPSTTTVMPSWTGPWISTRSSTCRTAVTGICSTIPSFT